MRSVSQPECEITPKLEYANITCNDRETNAQPFSTNLSSQAKMSPAPLRPSQSTHNRPTQSISHTRKPKTLRKPIQIGDGRPETPTRRMGLASAKPARRVLPVAQVWQNWTGRLIEKLLLLGNARTSGHAAVGAQSFCRPSADFPRRVCGWIFGAGEEVFAKIRDDFCGGRCVIWAKSVCINRMCVPVKPLAVRWLPLLGGCLLYGRVSMKFYFWVIEVFRTFECRLVIIWINIVFIFMVRIVLFKYSLYIITFILSIWYLNWLKIILRKIITD